MSIFFILISKLVPLYAMIALGFLGGRKLGVARESIGVVVMYLLVPFVMFAGTVKADITPATLSLPVLGFLIGCTLCLTYLRIGRKFWQDGTANILACTAGTGNTGYFGLPVAMALFDEQTVAQYIILMLGVTVYEASLGMYIAAKGRYSAQEAWRKVTRMPIIYAFVAGLLVHGLGLQLPAVFWDFMPQIRGAYVVLGMMIIGLGLASLKHFRLDWRFIGVAFSAKYVAWMALALTIVALDRSFLHWYGVGVHHALLLLAVVPMAANTVVIATLFDTHPEKAASAVLLSTLIAVFYVPFMASFILGY